MAQGRMRKKLYSESKIERLNTQVVSRGRKRQSQGEWYSRVAMAVIGAI